MSAVTHLLEIVPEAELRAAEAEGLITVRASGGLEIRNYSAQATYTKGSWSNPAVRRCRGLITEIETGRVVARSWEKFFNYGQEEVGQLDLDAPAEVTDKMDGSLGIVYRTLQGAVRVATRGSMESEQAFHATAWLNRQQWANDLRVDKVTPLTEIIYPENRIVCDYGDRDEMVILGGVHIETGEYLAPVVAATLVGWEGEIVDDFAYGSLQEALAAEPRAGAEGFCVRLIDENRIVKIKQEDYVKLHRIVTGLSAKSAWRHMTEFGVTDESLGELLAPLPDEFHDWTRDIWNGLLDAYNHLQDDARTAHAEILHNLPDGADRKAYALEAVKHETLRSYLFMLLDGRDPGPAILRTLEPIGNVQPREFEVE